MYYEFTSWTPGSRFIITRCVKLVIIIIAMNTLSKEWLVIKRVTGKGGE